MMRSHAGTKRPHVYPPTREQVSLVRLSIRFDGSYCTVDPMASISMANYASTNDGDAGTGMSEGGECNSIGDALSPRWHEPVPDAAAMARVGTERKGAVGCHRRKAPDQPSISRLGN